MWEVILLTGAFGFFAADGLVRLRLRAPLRRTSLRFSYYSLAALVTAALLIYLT